MFVQRFAKTVAVLLSLGVTVGFERFASVRWLSLLTLLLRAAWIPAARFAGRRFPRPAPPMPKGAPLGAARVP